MARVEATLLRAEMLLIEDQLPPAPTSAGGMEWRQYVTALKRKKQEVNKKVMDIRKQCTKLRKGLSGSLPAEPKIPQLPMWEEYMEQLKTKRQEILKMKSKAQDMARKLGDAATELLREPKRLSYREWERYYRAAAKFINNIMPVKKQADTMASELGGTIPEAPAEWEKTAWRDYVNELRKHKRKTKDLMKRVKEIRDGMKGNEMPEPPDGLNYDLWQEHRLNLKDIQTEIDKIRERGRRLQKEFKGTPDLPWDEEEDDESNKQFEWEAYIEDLKELIDTIENKRKEAKVWIKRFVEKLGVPENDMPPEPNKPYDENDWIEYIDKLANLEDELEDLKEQAVALREDEAFNDNPDRRRDLPKIRSPKQWTACVKEMEMERDRINGAVEKGGKLKKLMQDGNTIPDDPTDHNYENWKDYIKKMEDIKKVVEDMYPYADGLRDDSDKLGNNDAALADKIKRCRKPKNMSIQGWKDHILKMEKINPNKKHKDVDKDSEIKVGSFVKITGFHFFKFPLHNGMGKVIKVVLLDPYTIGYQVELEEGKYLDAQLNQFVSAPIDVGLENVVMLPDAIDGDLKVFMDKSRKMRAAIFKHHVGVEAAADKVKKIQDQIRLCSAWGKGVDVNALKNKEKKLRNQRTKTAGQGVKAGKAKAKCQKDLEAMEDDFLKEIKLSTSTWVWMNGIMRAGEIKNVMLYLKDLGYNIKQDPKIGPDKFAYELGMALELGSRAERARMIEAKTLSDPDGYIVWGDGNNGETNRDICKRVCISTDIGGQFKGHHPKPAKCTQDWAGWGNKKRNKTGCLKIYGKVPT